MSKEYGETVGQSHQRGRELTVHQKNQLPKLDYMEHCKKARQFPIFDCRIRSTGKAYGAGNIYYRAAAAG